MATIINAMGLFDAIASAAASASQLAYQISKDQRLTGAEREANAFTAQQNQLARDFSAEQASQQMEFQERMSNTQYQRGVADMKAAGINPALAMSNGGAVAPSGAAASASGAQSVSPAGGVISMSDLAAMMKLPAEVRILKEQAKNIAKDTEVKDTDIKEKSQRIEWNPQLWSSEIGLRSDQSSKLKAEVDSVLATTEGQRIYNEYSPALFQSQLDSAEVNRANMIAGIARMQSEIEHYAMQNEGIKADIGYKRALQVLTAAQTALANKQTESVSADVWRKDFENAFESRFGTLPNQPVWNNMAGMLGKFADLLDEGRSNFFDFVSGLFKKD